MDNRKETLLYGYISSVTLSTKLFTRNKDIRKFLEDETSLFDTKENAFKEYVYKTRTLILARAIRTAQKSANKSVLLHEFEKKFNEIREDETKKEKKETTRKKKNKFDELFDQLGK